VGLGGRLDAVNAFDADCALVMSVALDHMDYLGGSREEIGREKAGILRPGRPAIYGDADPPRSLLDYARDIGAKLDLAGRDFGYATEAQQWRYWGRRGERHALPHPVLRGDYQIPNAAACLAALDALHERLPVSASDVRMGLLTAENPGRFQVLPGRPMVILDVAHNPAAAEALGHSIARLPRADRTFAVFAMLKDKDIAGVIRAAAPHVDEWLVSGIEGPRGADAELIRAELARVGVFESVSAYGSIADAYHQACERAAQNDRIVVFGSFHTVAAVMAAR
jgi:dihydrofolate synthase / folylpolyglutamate synthase